MIQITEPDTLNAESSKSLTRHVVSLHLGITNIQVSKIKVCIKLSLQHENFIQLYKYLILNPGCQRSLLIAH